MSGELQRLIDRQQAGNAPPLQVDVTAMTGGGDASAAKQDEQTTLLTSIDGDTGSLVAALQARSSTVGATQNGIVALAVRDDALSTLAEAEGEGAPFMVDEFGRLWTVRGDAITASVDNIAIKGPTAQVKKSYNTTAQQTGTDVWSPASGKKIRVTDLIIGTYGTTAARLILFFSANADTTFTEGTDEALFKGSFAPSATVKPGAVVHFSPPFECATDDYELHITTDAALSVDIVVIGYEED